MMELQNNIYLIRGKQVIPDKAGLTLDELNRFAAKEGLPSLTARDMEPEIAKTATIAHQILSKHNTSNDLKDLKLQFDALASHDITYVGIVQTARASGLKEFPVP